jgi:transcriptional regulator with XRE-family HTH domain
MKVVIDNITYVPERITISNKCEFKQLIFDARKRRKETLDVASKNLNIARSYLFSLEKGISEPGLKIIQRILKYYNLDFNDIE